MIKDFGNKMAFDLFHKGSCKKIPTNLWQRAIFLLDIMDAVDDIRQLQLKGIPPSLRLHKLKGKIKDEFAIDINKVSGWRITFKFINGEFCEVKVENYH